MEPRAELNRAKRTSLNRRHVVLPMSIWGPGPYTGCLSGNGEQKESFSKFKGRDSLGNIRPAHLVSGPR